MIKKQKTKFEFRYILFSIFAVAMIGTLGFLMTKNMNETDAADMSGFWAGNIMSDEVMSDYSSMSEGEIQNWLNVNNPCNNTDYNLYLEQSRLYPNVQWHWDNGHFICMSEERFGDGQIIGSGDTAAHIIWQVAQDYRINPKVLLVLLQKENGLVTDNFPHSGQYKTATGFGCPDTSQCDAKYFGFKNQLRNAADLFREVLDGGWSNYPAYQDNYVQYNPNAGCGGTVVHIDNRATSALYRYTPYQPNAAALASSYGGGDACSAYGNRNFYSYFSDWFGDIHHVPIKRYPLDYVLSHMVKPAKEETDLTFEYNAHLSEYGWIYTTRDGEMIGTTGFAVPMEAITISSPLTKGIEYKTHIQDIGWEAEYKKDGEISGTTGQNKYIEAIQIRLNNELSQKYDVYYRTHIAGIGWSNWSKNDEISGTTGQNRHIEAVQMKFVAKNTIKFSTHVQDKGWMAWSILGMMNGTTGQAKQMEAIKIQTTPDFQGEISYRAHVERIGWMDWVKNGEIAGTTGQAKQMEAIEIKLSDALASQYDIYYRAHVEEIGWMDWVKNGETAGTTGQAKQMEAIEIRLQSK